MKKYTIKDIAQLAGVSKGTVDRVLHKRGKVSEIALEKVTKILNEIDYRPNPIAKNLKSNKIYKLAVILPDAQKDSYWEPCTGAIKEVESEFQHFGIEIKKYVFDATETSTFIKTSLEVIATLPDAILMVPLFQKEASKIAAKCTENNIKVSTFNNFIDSSYSNNFIGQDLYQSGRVAAKLMDMLLKKGTIGIIHIDEDYQNATHLQEKEKGFRSYFKSLKTSDYKITTVNLNYKKSEIFNASIDSFLEKNPNINGLFVTISKSYVVVEALKEKANTIAIVGYDLVKKNIDYLKQGQIDFLIHQNPKQQVYLGLSYLVEHFLFDKQIPPQLLLPLDIINSENIEGYLT
ncbi:substrate-binding domain-containing protein [Lutibacter sp. A64]|uniref:LacI family DNA-binding transcriptional regulator n=1 Tax=Lutibacter sp. A64 TaxID=2918526 RepID=UPI001F0669DD|nr:substrate-binding domain-containing protein [Lutibacter sp. A64]UMB52397.1 substrate-binding domain-containing protein [Lutibacter sp. A64]